MCIFINNEFTIQYYSIINNALASKCCDSPMEKHHIIPDSFFIHNRKFKSTGKSTGWLEGDPDNESNIVYLTPEDHMRCHILLTKMLPEDSIGYYKVTAALFWMFSRTNTDHLSDEDKVDLYCKIRQANRSTAAQRMENGTHHFLNPEWRAQALQKMIDRGTHPRKNKRLQKELSMRAMGDGTHAFFGGELQRQVTAKRMAEGTHNAIQTYTCPHCGKSAKGFVIFRYHFDNCKLNPSYKAAETPTRDQLGRLLKKDGTPQKKRGPKPKV